MSLRRDGAHTHFVDASDLHTFISGSLVPERVKLGDALKICNRIIFDFYISGTTCK